MCIYLKCIVDQSHYNYAVVYNGAALPLIRNKIRMTYYLSEHMSVPLFISAMVEADVTLHPTPIVFKCEYYLKLKLRHYPAITCYTTAPPYNIILIFDMVVRHKQNCKYEK